MDNGRPSIRIGHVYRIGAFLCPECRHLIANKPIGEMNDDSGQAGLMIEGECRCRRYRILIPPTKAAWEDRPQLFTPGD